MMKASEIRTILHGKVPPELIKILGLMAEDNQMLKQQNAALGAAFTQLASLMEVHTNILGDLKTIKDLRHGITEQHATINASMDDQERAIHGMKKGD
jgi:hypothetical protein